jgi:hypothetical protein
MVAYRCHGQAPSVGAVGRQLGRTSVASDELLKIVYNLERVPSGEPDNQLDVWAVALGGEEHLPETMTSPGRSVVRRRCTGWIPTGTGWLALDLSAGEAIDTLARIRSGVRA